MFNRGKMRRLREKNSDLQARNDALGAKVASLEDEVSAYKQKISNISNEAVNIKLIVKTVNALCDDPHYDEWDNHPAAMVLVQQTRAYCDTVMFQRSLENVPDDLVATEDKKDYEHQISVCDDFAYDWEKDWLQGQEIQKNRAWQRIYGKTYRDNPLFPPMQTDDFDSEKFAQFSRKEYESLVRSTDTPETDRIVIEPGIDAIYAEPWNYIRLTEWDCGLKRVATENWAKYEKMGFVFYWPFCMTSVESAGNHSAATACLYHKPLLAVGETEMHATTYIDYRESELFHRVDSDGTYWLKDGEPYCMVSGRQRAVVWAILHAIMESKGPVRYKGVSLNGNE